MPHIPVHPSAQKRHRQNLKRQERNRAVKSHVRNVVKIASEAIASGENDRVHIIDRDSLEVLTSFGESGRQPGEFYGVHSIATDSKGNIFTTETYRGQRVQKFVYKGLAPVTKKDQGVVWPNRVK